MCIRDRVNRVFCKKGSLGEILYGVVQRLGESFDKGTASGGTCLVQLYAVYGLITDLDAFHILSANIYDTVNLRVKESCCIVRGNGLNFPLIQQKSGLHQSLAVACGTGKCNAGILRKNAVDLLDRTDGCLKRASVIIAVEGDVYKRQTATWAAIFLTTAAWKNGQNKAYFF